MKKLFRFIFRIIPILLIILAVAGYFFYMPWRNWCDTQTNKVKGVYHIYQGDKALERSKDPDANIAKELSNAVKLYNKGLKEFPGHYQARCNLASIYVLFEDYSSAVEQYKLALKYKPDYLECRMDYGLLEAEELSRYDDAIEQYKEITNTKKRSITIPLIYSNADSIKENKINAYYNTGLAYRGKTMFTPKERLRDNQYLKEAVRAYNSAVESYNKYYRFNRKKNNYDTLYNLGLTHHHLGNIKEAGLNYCKAIEAAPLNYEAHLNLAILLDKIGEYDLAIEEFTNAGMLVKADDYETVMYLNDLLNNSYKKNAIMKEIKAQRKYENQEKEAKEGFFARFFKKDNPKKEHAKKEQHIIFKDGKAKIQFESDAEFNNNIKKCKAKKIFKEL